MSLFSRTPVVESAEAAVADLVATVAKWTALADAAAERGGDLGFRLGELMLDDEAAGAQAAAEIARLQGECRAAMSAAEAAERRLEAARRVVLTERALVLRGRADRLEKAAAVRQKRTDELLAQLSAFEACTYVVPEPASAMGTIPGQGRREYPQPLTRVVVNHVAKLTAQANELERQARDLDADALAVAVAKPLQDRYEFDQAVADDGTFTGDAKKFNGFVAQSLIG